MAFTDPITLNQTRTATTIDFVVQNRFANGANYVEETATGTDQRTIVLRHSNAGPSVAKGAKPIRRHFVQFNDERYNATLGKTERATINVTITVDPGSTAALIGNGVEDLVSFAKDFLDMTNVEKLLRDES